MNIPEQVSTQVHDETFAGVTYHIRGELVPELQIDLTDAKVFFEHHTLLWKQTDVKIELRHEEPGAAEQHVANALDPLGLRTGLFGGGGKFIWNRFSGPGRVAIQTMYINPVEGDDTVDTSD